MIETEPKIDTKIAKIDERKITLPVSDFVRLTRKFESFLLEMIE